MIQLFLKLILFFFGSILFPKIFWLVVIIFFDYFFYPEQFLTNLFVLSFLFDFIFLQTPGLTLILLSSVFLLISFFNRWFSFENFRERLIVSFVLSIVFLFAFFFFQGIYSWYNIFLFSWPTLILLILSLTLGYLIYGRNTISYR